MLLCVMMVVSLFVGIVPAASAAGGESDDNGIVTSKTYDPDKGILTIEAYATGKTVTTVTEESVPCDIVLVLDVSGSMSAAMTNEPEVGNTKSCSGMDTTKPNGYYCAYKGKGISTGDRPCYYDKNKGWMWEPNIGSDRKIVGDSYDIHVYKSKLGCLMDAANTFIDTVAADATANNVDHKISIVTYSNSAKNVKTSVSALTGSSELKSAINLLNANGATAADYGMKNAKDIVDSITRDSNKVVVLFTDGVPTHGSASDDFSGDSEAKGVASSAISYSKSMKAAGTTVYTVGVFNNGTTKSIDTYMNGVSSNYANATSYENLGSQTASGYYFTANSASSLNSVFQSIATETTSGGSHTTLDKNAYVKDVVTKYFDLKYGTETSEIKVYTAPCTGENSSGENIFGNATEFTDAQVAIKDKTITVTNFDFSGNWCGMDSGKPHGKKLIIEIPIVPISDMIDAGQLPTNGPESGVYDGDGNSVEKFPIPEVNIEERTFVIDYAEKLNLDASKWGQSSVSGLRDKVGSNAAPVLSYGTASYTGSTVSYAPNTMNWTGSDSLYSYKADGGVDHTWAKLNFVPANNVYYEDTFVSTDGSGIVYDGTWSTDGRSAGNEGTANTDVTAGSWKNAALGDDSGYSNGSAHMAIGSKDNLATATFNFTGTGFDVYSRTNGTTGTIFATVEGNGVNKSFLIDNNLEGKDFYQVPTLSVGNLSYGTYTVTIYVTPAAGADRAAYYLDGIRVYNPANRSEDGNYAETERNAKFAEVRDNIIKADAFSVDSEEAGAVFVDTVASGATVADYITYGPKHEVYLASGQAIVFNVGRYVASNSYYVGISAPEGAATATVTNGERTSDIDVNHASDLYYKITPNGDGYIMIKNNSDNAIAVSKLCVAGEAPVMMFRTMSYAPTMSYVSSFSTMSLVPYEEEPVVDPADPADPTEPSDPADPTEPSDQPASSIIKTLVDNLFRSIKNLFKWF